MPDEGYLETSSTKYPRGNELELGKIYTFDGCICLDRNISPSIDVARVSCEASGYPKLCCECHNEMYDDGCVLHNSGLNRTYIYAVPVLIGRRVDTGLYKVEVIWTEELE